MTDEKLESQEVYKKIFESSPEAMLLIDTKGKIVKANERVTDWLGYKVKEIEGKNMASIPFLTIASKAKVIKKFAQRMLGKDVGPYDLFFRDKKEKEFIGLISAVPIHNDDGKIIFDFVIISNVTEQRQIEGEIQKKTKLLDKLSQDQEMILDSIPAMVFYKDTKNNILKVNKNFAESMSMKKEELEGKSCSVLWPNDAEKYFKDDKEVIKSGKSKRDIIEQLETPKGIKWIKTDKILLHNEENKVTGILGFALDITKQKQAEDELIYRSEFESLINNISKEFINLPVEQLDASINKTLESLGKFFKVDRSYIFKFKEDFKKMQNTYEWCEKGITSQINDLQDLTTKDFPWWMSKLKKFENVYIHKVDDLGENKKALRKTLQSQNIKSLIVVPIVYGNKLGGFLGFDSVQREKEWSDEVASLIRIVGEIIMNAQERVSGEKSIMGRNEELERMNKLMVGRELKMTELKDKIKSLESKK